MQETAKQCKRRPLQDFWSLFTCDEDPHRALCARCRHCGNVINYHKKSEQAQTHLNKCPPFKKFFYGLPLADRPSWYTGGKRSRVAVTSESKNQPRLAFVQQMTVTETQRFEDLFAMHWYVTGNSFSRASDPHLLQALQVSYYFFPTLRIYRSYGLTS